MDASNETETTQPDAFPLDPEEATAGRHAERGSIPDATTLGAVHLGVSDLGRSLDYYRRAIGLDLLDEGDGRAVLGSGGRELLVLVDQPGARPADGYSGLFHIALLVPERSDLARWLAHATRERVPMTGASDHYVSEALYLRDPDHHGIEIYADRPRRVWEGQVGDRLTSIPLDLDDLLRELDDPAQEPFDGLADGTIMGHVHLRVASVPETNAFYRDVLGFALMAQLGNQATFLSAGGYHHHLGGNTWESAGAPQAPPDRAALRHYTVVLPTPGDRDDAVARLAAAGHEAEDTEAGPLVRDPSGNGLVLTTA
jgi:catechol 2,3-dioxygenase